MRFTITFIIPFLLCFVVTAQNQIQIDSVKGVGRDAINITYSENDGVHVSSAGGSGIYVDSVKMHGVYVDSAARHGFWVRSTGSNGFMVYNAGQRGIYIREAGNVGILVVTARDQGVWVSSAGGHGFQVSEAGVDGLSVGNAGGDGFSVNSAGVNGLDIHLAENYGVRIDSATVSGIDIRAVGGNGLQVRRADGYGVKIDRSNLDGVFVSNAENGVHAFSNDRNGIYADNNTRRAALLIGDAQSSYPAVEIAHENDALADLHIGGIARIRSDSAVGISLAAMDRPMITREWDLFTKGSYTGIGRWGLFMEENRLVLGIPDLIGKEIEFAKYAEDGTRIKLGGVDQNGNICAVLGHTTCSDIRYKKEVEGLQGSLSNVLKMRGVSYQWDLNSSWSGPNVQDEQVGLIAQEVEKIYPQLVSTDEDGYKSVAYNKLTPILLEAIKEQQVMIQSLQKENALIKEEQAAIRQKLEKIMALME